MGRDGALELSISRTFVKQILWAHKLIVRFPGSWLNEGWESDLSGTRYVAKRWMQCVHAMFNVYEDGDDV
jgi:hypothetical protein